MQIATQAIPCVILPAIACILEHLLISKMHSIAESCSRHCTDACTHAWNLAAHSASKLQEKQSGVNGCCSKAHMLQVSRELLLELHGLQQRVNIRHSAEKDNHPFLSFQKLDVTLAPVAWMCTLQINTAESPTVVIPPSHLAAGLQMGLSCLSVGATGGIRHWTQLTLQNWLIAALSASSGSNFCNAHSCSSSRSTPCASLSCTSH